MYFRLIAQCLEMCSVKDVSPVCISVQLLSFRCASTSQLEGEQYFHYPLSLRLRMHLTLTQAIFSKSLHNAIKIIMKTLRQ